MTNYLHMTQPPSDEYAVAVPHDDPHIAAEIIHELVGPIQGQIYWDVPTPNPTAVQLTKDAGFRPIRRLLRMWSGRPNAGDVSRQYAIADPATG